MKRHAPSAERNRGPILDALRPRLPSRGLLLEIASGTGQHAVHLAEHLPHLVVQPSDRDVDALASIEAHRLDSGLPNLRAAVELDAAAASWPIARAEAIFSANMIHIAPWAATEGLFAGAGRLLEPGARLFTYGPYLVDGLPTTESNAAFDASLRERNPAWGLRDVGDLAALAGRHGLAIVERVEMPANNFLLVFERRTPGTAREP